MIWKIINKWVKLFKNGPNKIFERQPLKNLTCSILEYIDLNVCCLYCLDGFGHYKVIPLM